MRKSSYQQSPLDKLEEQMQMQEETSSQQGAAQPEEQGQAQSEEYIPDDKEKNLYHLLLEKPLFDRMTGKRISKPYVQKFNDRAYKKFTEKKNGGLSNAEMLGYTFKVLWNPETNKND